MTRTPSGIKIIKVRPMINRSTVNLCGGGGEGHVLVQDLETKANRDSQSTLEKVSFFGWYSRSGTRKYLSALAGLVGLELENIFPTG